MKLLGIKHDAGKTPLHLLPTKAVREVAKVLAFGAEKYGPHNWRGGMDHSRLHSAALRHLLSDLENETFDKESNLMHLAHCACNILMLIECRLEKVGNDDRYKYDK